MRSATRDGIWVCLVQQCGEIVVTGEVVALSGGDGFGFVCVFCGGGYGFGSSGFEVWWWCWIVGWSKFEFGGSELLGRWYFRISSGESNCKYAVWLPRNCKESKKENQEI